MISGIGLLLLLRLSATPAGALASDLELQPLFTGYEHGCEIPAAAEEMITWTNPDELGHLAPPATIPSLWAKHVGTAGVDDRVDHWYVTVPLQEVRFHGLPVARLERWYGKSNGISGWALVLDARPEEARRLIDEREFRPDESGNFKPELLIDEESKDTKLVCDFSM